MFIPCGGRNAAKSFLISWQSVSWARNTPPVTELECSFPCTQKPPIGPYPEPDESSSNDISLRYILILSPSTPSSPKWHILCKFLQMFERHFPLVYVQFYSEWAAWSWSPTFYLSQWEGLCSFSGHFVRVVCPKLQRLFTLYCSVC